jgi:hypothetical protein
VMLASRQIFPVVSIKWRLQDDLSTLSAEVALITGAALCDAGLTPDLLLGIKWRSRKDFISWSAEQALKTFFFPATSVSGVALCYASRTPDLPRGQHQAEAAGGLVLLVSRTGLDNIPTFCIRRGAV